MVLALRAGGERRRTVVLLAGALLLAASFAAIKLTEYAGLLAAGITPDSAPFFVYYFVLTGVHLLHLLIGAVLLATLLVRVLRGHDSQRFSEGVATYWHMVDLLWIALFALLYLVPVT